MLWCIVLVCSSLASAYLIYICISIYISRPYTAVFRIEPTSEPQLPLVTICNLNPYRLTELARRQWHKPLRSALSSSDLDSSNIVRGIANISTRDFFTYTSHQLSDVLIRCQYNSKSCSERQFSTSLTEHGLCHTFQPPKPDKFIYGEETISLLMDAESYEAPSDVGLEVGFKVILHPPETYPSPGHSEVVVPVGTCAHLLLRERQESFPAPPTGSCDSEAKSLPTCIEECKVKVAQRLCGCKPFWVAQQLGEAKRTCNAAQHFECIQKISDEELSSCVCPQPCITSTYSTTAHYSSLSPISLTSVMPDNAFSQLKKRYEDANNIKRRMTPESWQEDKKTITAVTFALDEVVQGFEKLKQNLSQAVFDVKNIQTEMHPRMKFHIKVALEGLKRTVDLGFNRGWHLLEERALQQITSDFRETLALYDRAINQLRYTSTSETVMRKVVYFTAETVLSAKLDLAVHSLDNLTKVYYAYLNAEPLFSYHVTPDKRYDPTLIPYEVLNHNSEKQREFYNGISDNLAKYIEHILSLKTVLKEVYNSNNLNESSYQTSRLAFLHHSEAINYFRGVFREKIIDKTLFTLERNIHEFQKINHTFTLVSRDTLMEIEKLREDLINKYSKLHEPLLILAQKAQQYIHDNTFLQSQLLQESMTENVDLSLRNMQEIFVDLKLAKHALTEVIHKLKKALQAMWLTMLQDEALRSFYYQLHNDVEDMIKNPMKASFFLHIFLHKKMLGLTESEAEGLTPEDFIVLMNADLPVIQVDRKLEDIDKLILSLTQKTDAPTAVGSGISLLIQNIDKFKDKFYRFVENTQLNGDFVKDNWVKIDISVEHKREIMEETAQYTLVELISHIGGIVAIFLGASIITVLELVDSAVMGVVHCRSSCSSCSHSDTASVISINAHEQDKLSRAGSCDLSPDLWTRRPTGTPVMDNGGRTLTHKGETYIPCNHIEDMSDSTI